MADVAPPAFEAEDRLRPGEATVSLPAQHDEGVHFIGRIRTPWTARRDCPRRGDAENGPVCKIEVDERWRGALDGLRPGATLQVLYGMHHARRDLVRQSPRSDGRTAGTFSLRSPMRPNPIASSRSEEHTSELQSRQYLACRLLLEKKKTYHPPLTQTHAHSQSRLCLKYLYCFANHSGTHMSIHPPDNESKCADTFLTTELIPFPYP